MGQAFYHIVVAAVSAALLVPLSVPASVPAWAQASGAQEKTAPPDQQPSGQPPTYAPGSQTSQSAPPQTPAGERDNAPGQSDDRRFVFHRLDNGMLRLDMRTGAVAACTPAGTEWTCVPARDDRAALDRQIAQLQRDNAALKNALLEHGVPLPSGMTAPSPSVGGGWSDDTIPRPPQTVPPTPAAAGPSTEGEIDRIVDAVEKGWRRLVDMVTNIQRDLQKKD